MTIKKAMSQSVFDYSQITAWWYEHEEENYEYMNSDDNDDSDNNVTINWHTKRTIQDNKHRKDIYMEILITKGVNSISRNTLNI